MAHAPKATATILVSAMLAALATRAEAGLEDFPATAEARIREDRVSAAVNGQPLPLVTRRVWHMDTPGQYFMELAAAHFAADGPVLIDVITDPAENVYPMVPAGAGLTEMLLV